jgi:hypothetical protein
LTVLIARKANTTAQLPINAEARTFSVIRLINAITGCDCGPIVNFSLQRVKHFRNKYVTNIGFVKFRRVYDEAGNLTETHEQAGDFKEVVRFCSHHVALRSKGIFVDSAFIG